MKLAPITGLLTLLALPSLVGAGYPPAEARLMSGQGPVTLTTADQKSRGTPPFFTPFSLCEGDVIQTGTGATAEISFNGKTLVHVKPGSVLRLTRIADQTIQLNLKSGVLLAKVHFDKARGQQFSVVTPSAVATVRGTEFVVEESGSLTRVGVLDEGHVAVTAPGFKKEVMMHFNQETQVTRGLSPHDAHVLDRLYSHKTEMADMRQRLRPIRKSWMALTPEQSQRVRAAWIKKNRRRVKH